MKRSIILSMVATMAIMLNAQQLRIQQAPCAMAAPQATSEETLSMEYSYCGDIESQIGWGVAGSIRAVIEVKKLEPYFGMLLLIICCLFKNLCDLYKTILLSL